MVRSNDGCEITAFEWLSNENILITIGYNNFIHAYKLIFTNKKIKKSNTKKLQVYFSEIWKYSIKKLIYTKNINSNLDNYRNYTKSTKGHGILFIKVLKLNNQWIIIFTTDSSIYHIVI